MVGEGFFIAARRTNLKVVDMPKVINEENLEAKVHEAHELLKTLNGKHVSLVDHVAFMFDVPLTRSLLINTFALGIAVGEHRRGNQQ